VKGVTEETASILAGQMNAMRINQIEASDILRQQLMSLSVIAQNTSYNVHLSKLDRIVTLLEAQSSNSLRSQGLA
jgi:DNA-binding Xre family transcriptional regulator